MFFVMLLKTLTPLLCTSKSDKKGSSKTSILMGKSRVAPQATIPRLELSAAVTGARLYQKIVD